MITKQGKYYVYEHSLDGIIFYVGSGNWYRPNRFDNRTKHWLDYVKNRQNDVIVSIIKEFDDKYDAYNYEIEWSIKRRQEGYPIVGSIGKKHSDEWKHNHSEKIKGHIVTEETRNKIREMTKGKTRTLEQRKNISNGKKGKPSNMKGKHHTDEAKIKIGNASRGRKLSEETKKKISETMKKKFEKRGEL